MVRSSTRFQRNFATGLCSEEPQHFGPVDPTAEQRTSARIRTVRLENILRDIQTDYANFRHGRLV